MNSGLRTQVPDNDGHSVRLLRRRLPLLIGVVAVMLMAFGIIWVANRNSARPLPKTTLSRTESQVGSVAELARSAALVVAGSVASVESFCLHIDVERVLKGTPYTSPLCFAWEGFVTEGGKRTLEIVHNGIEMPKKAEKLLVFLTSIGRYEGKNDVYLVNTLDGILRVGPENTLQTTIDNRNRLSARISGQTVDEIDRLVREA